MSTIYRYNDEYETNRVIDRVNEISEEIEEEISKPYEQADKERELQLRYKQLIASLPLSTGFVKLY